MKLISFNIWGGTKFEPLMEFVREQAVDTDIFCFQEVFDTPTNEAIYGGTRVNLLRELRLALPNFSSWFAPEIDGFTLEGPADIAVTFGSAILIRKPIPIARASETFVHKQGGIILEADRSKPRALQSVHVVIKETLLSIYNFHGLVPRGEIIPNHVDGDDPKIDTPERVEQSRRIRSILEADTDQKIVCGDFNLRPDTESMQIVAGNDLKNMITEYSITDTRGPLHEKPIKFADHMLVSSGVVVQNFRVPRIAVSDHLPLILKFDLT